jgi:hypothetical protein
MVIGAKQKTGLLCRSSCAAKPGSGWLRHAKVKLEMDANREQLEAPSEIIAFRCKAPLKSRRSFTSTNHTENKGVAWKTHRWRGPQQLVICCKAGVIARFAAMSDPEVSRKLVMRIQLHMCMCMCRVLYSYS